MASAPLKAVLALSFMLFLSSCSYTYPLRVIVVEGRVAFISEDDRADCIRGITVEVDDLGPSAVPVQGDDAQAVQNGVYWQMYYDGLACRDNFPVLYGASPTGPLSDVLRAVAPKRLMVGQVYHVTTESSGSGYGSGYFRISANGHIENWSNDPSPPILNEAGYVIERR